MNQEERMAEEGKGFQGTADDLYSTVVTTEEGTTFNEKIIAIQAELKAPKNQLNKFGNYNYRSCEDILEGVKPLLKKYGLMQRITDKVVQIGDRYYIEATVSVTDGSNGADATAYAREPESKKGMDDSQVTGTASSYARKYALNGMWLIDDTKDADTDEHKNQVENAPVKKQSDDKPWLNATSKDGSLTKNGEYTAQRLFNGETDWKTIYDSVKVSKKDKEAVDNRVKELESDDLPFQ